ncbi:MAG: hypothetical protein LBF88_02410 [Planctomycetaceae bacterium]|jgi:hypothetical protein|nr:hypothetical protein [Planctomycetaceae bacterium]
MFFIIVSIIIFFVGHLLNVLRWELFVQIYEQLVRHRLLTSLSIGYLVNHIVPMRIDELVSVVIASTQSKYKVFPIAAQPQPKVGDFFS